jgi:hypothetical protein
MGQFWMQLNSYRKLTSKLRFPSGAVPVCWEQNAKEFPSNLACLMM